MAQNIINNDDIVQLVRLGLLSDSRQVAAFGRRLARRLRKTSPDASEAIVNVIASMTDSKRSITRKAPMPVNSDVPASQHQLLMTDFPPLSIPEPTLPSALVNRLDEFILEQRSAKILEDAGLPPARTALFVGPPGVGKTLTAHWLAKKLNREIFVLDLAAVSNSLLGRTGTNIKEALEYCKSREAVLLIDEFDSIAKRRDDQDDIGEMKRIVTVLLQEIDRWPTNSILLAATNHGELLDSAIWRRFDLTLEFPVAQSETSLTLLKQIFDESLDAKIIDLLSEFYAGKPMSEIAKFGISLKKTALLHNLDLAKIAKSHIEHELIADDKTRAREVAVKMMDVGFSQRKVSEVTGLARDTIRKLKDD